MTKHPQFSGRSALATGDMRLKNCSEGLRNLVVPVRFDTGGVWRCVEASGGE